MARPNESLLVLDHDARGPSPSNVAAAVHPEHRYLRARVGDEIVYLGKERIDLLTELAGAS